jgi:hypothetical protein
MDKFTYFFVRQCYSIWKSYVRICYFRTRFRQSFQVSVSSIFMFILSPYSVMKQATTTSSTNFSLQFMVNLFSIHKNVGSLEICLFRSKGTQLEPRTKHRRSWPTFCGDRCRF